MGLANRDPLVGLTLDGKYEIVRPIARGGMGRVYRAIQRPLGREVALKVLDMEQLEGQKAGGDFAQRFFLEAAACARLTHPNTVVVYDYGCAEDEVFYIAMELLEGPTLEAVLERSAPLDPATTVHLGLQICGSLGEAHERGMVHRDLKPSNVMLIGRGGEPNFVKVLDFGLVKQDDQGLTQSGALLGTPRYISPEQIASSDVGPESDIYSLGAVLYHCLTGRPPFDNDSQFALLASHMSVEPAPVEAANPSTEASAELRAVVMRCLAKEPRARFPSMRALADALLACPEESGTAASSLVSSAGGLSGLRAGASIERSGIQPSSPERTRAESPVAKSAAKTHAPSRPRGLVAGAVVLGLLLGVGAVLWWRMGAPAPAPEPSAPALAPDPSASAPATAAEVSAEAPGRVPTSGPVTIESEPPGARVRHDGRDLGDTPLTVVVPEGERWTLVLSLPGHERREITVTAGQGTVRATLAPLHRRRGMRRTASAHRGAASAPSTSMAAPDVAAEEPAPTQPAAERTEPAEGPRERAEPPVTHRPRTDNRDPWAEPRHP